MVTGIGLTAVLFSAAIAMFVAGCAQPRSAGAPVSRPAFTNYPAPAGEPASADYSVAVEGQPVFVYSAQVLNAGPASFAYFDFSGSVRVEIKPAAAVKSVVVRPLACGIVPAVKDGVISFSLSVPSNLSIEVNGADKPLLLFANPPEVNPPKKDDPNVLYFGPGIHEVSTMPAFGSGKTIYIAGGAVVRAKLGATEKPIVEHGWAGNPVYENLWTFKKADKVSIRGRGILDCSALPWQSKSPVVLAGCTNVLAEGIIIKDAPSWCIPQFNCKQVHLDSLKMIAHRQNSDGINIVNSQDVLVERCFLRTNDDNICVKTFVGQPAAKNIRVKDCVIWNDRNFGIGITYETRSDISDVLFSNCDMIHDWGVASLVVYVADSGTVSDVRFEKIRLEDTRHQLIKLWIGKDFFGKDAQRGHIRGVSFSDIAVAGPLAPSELTGFDPSHLIENVSVEHLVVDGVPVGNAEAGKLRANEHVRNLRVSP